MSEKEMHLIAPGQKVWRRTMGNLARYGHTIEPKIVDTVGRKYFTLQGDKRTRFRRDTLHEETQHSINYRVYLDKTTYDEEEEYSEKHFKINRYFSNYLYGTHSKLTLQQVRDIFIIMNPDRTHGDHCKSETGDCVNSNVCQGLNGCMFHPLKPQKK